MKFVERPEHEVAAKKGCDGQNHMKIYHDNRLSLRQTVAFKTKCRGDVHLCFVVATFLLVTRYVLQGLLNLELQLALSPFKFLICSHFLLSKLTGLHGAALR